MKPVVWTTRNSLGQFAATSPIEHFERNVDRLPEAPGCWLWIGPRVGSGYGAFHCNGSFQLAHRVSYQLHIGSIPPGLWVLHRCDLPACVRPDHLFLGTQTENMRDAARKRRIRTPRPPRRDEHPQAKLTTSEITEIIASYERGLGAVLAKRYGVSRGLITRIVRQLR